MSEARAHGAPVLQGHIRSAPEDFIVEELDAFAASGSGEHLLLRIEKRGMNTAHAAQRIARWAGVAESAIGYAGLKDRHALTTQRFSVWLPKRVSPAIETLGDGDGDGDGSSDEALRVLDAHWHSRKLPRGALAGNRFILTLREVRGVRAAVEARLQAIAAQGVPNAFGEQRFGRAGGNIEHALSMFAGRRVRRDQRGILLSAARSQLFNQVLDARIRAGNWNSALDGEVWMLDGSHSVFGPAPFSDELGARLAGQDIHPTGPLWGRGALRSTASAAAIERDALSDPQSLALREGLEEAGLKQERRSLRLPVTALAWDWPADDVLQLRFELPAGSYATSVLAELGETLPAGPAARSPAA